jgi:hypothetical protein
MVGVGQSCAPAYTPTNAYRELGGELVEGRVVRDEVECGGGRGKVVVMTGGGVTAGIDFGLGACLILETRSIRAGPGRLLGLNAPRAR